MHAILNKNYLGPPGTGKTRVGAIAVKVLLDNL